MTSLPVVANDPAGSSIDYRVVVLVDGVEMDRHSVDSLLIKAETVRTGSVVPATFHRCVQRYPVHHCIGVCVIWPLRHGAAPAHARPRNRRGAGRPDRCGCRGDEGWKGRAHPCRRSTCTKFTCSSAVPRHPSLDRTVPDLLPFPQRDSPMVGHRSSGTRTDGSTSMRFLNSEGRPWKMIRSTGSLRSPSERSIWSISSTCHS